MPRNSFTESKYAKDAALVPDANVAAETTKINANEIRLIRRKFRFPVTNEESDGVVEISDFLDIIYFSCCM